MSFLYYRLPQIPQKLPLENISMVNKMNMNEYTSSYYKEVSAISNIYYQTTAWYHLIIT